MAWDESSLGFGLGLRSPPPIKVRKVRRVRCSSSSPRLLLRHGLHFYRIDFISSRARRSGPHLDQTDFSLHATKNLKFAMIPGHSECILVQFPLVQTCSYPIELPESQPEKIFTYSSFSHYRIFDCQGQTITCQGHRAFFLNYPQQRPLR